jgi:hypothetical protein
MWQASTVRVATCVDEGCDGEAVSNTRSCPTGVGSEPAAIGPVGCTTSGCGGHACKDVEPADGKRRIGPRRNERQKGQDDASVMLGNLSTGSTCVLRGPTPSGLMFQWPPLSPLPALLLSFRVCVR